MKDRATTERPGMTRLEVDRWTADVLARIPQAAARSAGLVAFPTIEQWGAWIAASLSNEADASRRHYLKFSPSVEIFRDRIAAGDALGGIEIVCKRNRIGFLDRFRATRAERNFRRGWRLLNSGIETAMPLAVIRRRTPRHECCLVTQFVPNLVDLDRIAMLELPRISGDCARALKRTLIERIATLLAKLRSHGLHHRDLKASNILVASANTLKTPESPEQNARESWIDVAPRLELVAPPLVDGARTRMAPPSRGGATDSEEAMKLCILDLDGLGTASKWRPGRRWQPLMRLAASLIGYRGVTRADYARCLRRYLVLTDGNDDEWKMRYRRLAAQAARYSSSSRRRKRGKLDGMA